jgi:peptidoglycan hydrolase CwlO-like protein
MNQQREIDQLKYQIEKLNKNIENREVEFKERGEDRRKKRGF